MGSYLLITTKPKDAYITGEMYENRKAWKMEVTYVQYSHISQSHF